MLALHGLSAVPLSTVLGWPRPESQLPSLTEARALDGQAAGRPSVVPAEMRPGAAAAAPR